MNSIVMGPVSALMEFLVPRRDNRRLWMIMTFKTVEIFLVFGLFLQTRSYLGLNLSNTATDDTAPTFDDTPVCCKTGSNSDPAEAAAVEALNVHFSDQLYFATCMFVCALASLLLEIGIETGIILTQSPDIRRFVRVVILIPYIWYSSALFWKVFDNNDPAAILGAGKAFKDAGCGLVDIPLPAPDYKCPAVHGEGVLDFKQGLVTISNIGDGSHQMATAVSAVVFICIGLVYNGMLDPRADTNDISSYDAGPAEDGILPEPLLDSVANLLLPRSFHRSSA